MLIQSVNAILDISFALFMSAISLWIYKKAGYVLKQKDE